VGNDRLGCALFAALILGGLACGEPAALEGSEVARDPGRYLDRPLELLGAPELALEQTDDECFFPRPCNSAYGEYAYGDLPLVAAPEYQGVLAHAYMPKGCFGRTCGPIAFGCMGNDDELVCAPALPERITSVFGAVRARDGGFIFEVSEVRVADPLPAEAWRREATPDDAPVSTCRAEDDDADGLPNHFETFRLALDGDDAQAAWDHDSDGDGLSDAEEKGPGECFVIRDTDRDQVPDFLDRDSDNDGFSDTYETFFSDTSPLDPDSDGDGCVDGLEELLDGCQNETDMILVGGCDQRVRGTFSFTWEGPGTLRRVEGRLEATTLSIVAIAPPSVAIPAGGATIGMEAFENVAPGTELVFEMLVPSFSSMPASRIPPAEPHLFIEGTVEIYADEMRLARGRLVGVGCR